MVEHEVTGWIDRLNFWFSRVSMWLVAVIIGVMAYEVVMRYAFERPTLWASELSLWLAGMVYLFAGLYAMQQRSHIRIFILYDIAPRWLRKLFDIISTACIVLFAMATVWGGYGEAKAKLLRWETFGTAFDPPIPATMKPLVLLTVIILALQAVSNLIYDWKREPESHSPLDD
jgi:TRAP-type mannitol/chloroaromatic compound transport system permease small subunit